MFKIEDNKVCYIENNQILAYVTYPFIEDGVVVINHTIVDESLRGKGIASKLLSLAYEDIKKRNLKAKLECSYAIKWFLKNTDCKDILI